MELKLAIGLTVQRLDIPSEYRELLEDCKSYIERSHVCEAELVVG